MTVRWPSPDCASASSVHPLAAAATGEVIGEVLATGRGPGLAVLQAGGAHAASVSAAADAVVELVDPEVLIVIGDRSASQGIDLWATFGGTLESSPLGTGDAASPVAPVEATAIVVASTVEDLVDTGRRLDGVVGGGSTVGGTVPAGVMAVLRRRDGTGGDITPGRPAVTLLAGGSTAAWTAQMWRPIGEPMAITGAEGPVVTSLAGRPALDRVDEVVSALDPDRRRLAAEGLHLGWVIDDRADVWGVGDFVVRPILGAVTERRAIAMEEPPPLGAIVQFHISDPALAGPMLSAAIRTGAPPRGRASGALLFAGGERPGDPADLAATLLGTSAVTVIRTEAELGPVGGRSLVHRRSVTGIALPM